MAADRYLVLVVLVVHLRNGGFVSLRATARDDRGHVIEQTTGRAYELGV